MAEKKIHQETHVISKKRGNGILSREVWVDLKTGQVTRYSLAYINHRICGLDNGRVLGYDNAHGYHHRHFMGTVEPIDFSSYVEIEERFEREWLKLREEIC